MLASTYHQVWWPDVPVRYRDGDELPVWHAQVGGYVDGSVERPCAAKMRPG